MTDGPKILIVDDEPNIRDLLTTSLRFAGFAVRAVGNGAQAISAVLEEEPDLIILDVMLPDINGFGVTKRLRASGYTAPILFLTAKDDTEDKITGLTVGGDDYVTSRSRSTRSWPASKPSCAGPCKTKKTPSSAPASSRWTRTRTRSPSAPRASS